MKKSKIKMHFMRVPLMAKSNSPVQSALLARYARTILFFRSGTVAKARVALASE